MIPDVDPVTLENGAERTTYAALKAQLPDAFTVFHSYPWLRLWRGDREKALLEGEADFVILHRELGLLVLEVKGGYLALRSGVWVRETKSGPVEIRNPFAQARRNMHALLEIASDYSRGYVRRDDFAHGYAVVFPDMDYQGAPPPDADRAIIICRKDLTAVRAAVEDAYRRWTSRPQPLRPDRYSTLLRALTPEFQFIRPIGPAVEEAARQLLMLTESQAQAFEQLLRETPRALVEGPAGSGKTILALHRAARFAASGRRTLFVCFNKFLASWLRERVRADTELDAEAKHRLEVWHFHGLAADLAARAKIPFEPLDGDRGQHFWDHEVPDVLSQAVGVLEETEAARYDAVVVDEAQDFSPLWWFTITEDLLVSPNAPLYVFLDPEQSLRGRVERPEIGLPSAIPLDTNCRNTKRVTRFAADLLGLKVKSYRFSPEGVDAKIIRAADHNQQKGLVQQRLKRMLSECGLAPSQVVLLGPARKENGALADVAEVHGHELVTSPDAWREGKGVLVTTARSFKGLEAAAVLVYDVGGFSRLFSQADLYVACTRATFLLEIIVHDERVRANLRGLLHESGEDPTLR